MIDFSVKVTGVDAIGRRMTKRTIKAKKLRWVEQGFRSYILDKRLPQMWRGQGQIPGRYGEGSRKWAANKPWVARAKGFNKPLFGTRGKSTIQDAYVFSKTTSMRGGASRSIGFRLANTHEAVKYLEEGYPKFTVRPKRAGGTLAIPYKPGVTMYRKETHPGPMKPRWIQGFVRGDLKWLAAYAAREALKV